jgi:hypothetical protein
MLLLLLLLVLLLHDSSHLPNIFSLCGTCFCVAAAAAAEGDVRANFVFCFDRFFFRSSIPSHGHTCYQTPVKLLPCRPPRSVLSVLKEPWGHH